MFNLILLVIFILSHQGNADVKVRKVNSKCHRQNLHQALLFSPRNGICFKSDFHSEPTFLQVILHSPDSEIGFRPSEIAEIKHLLDFLSPDELGKFKPEMLSCPRSEIQPGISKYENEASDRLFPAQWYLHDCKSPNERFQYNINVIPVWRENNFGQGIKIIVIDDGVDSTQEDLIKNYDRRYEIDLTETKPSHPSLSGGSHGTRSAGIISMEKDNGICGCGIAPLATIGSVKLHAPSRTSVSLMNVARALLYKTEEIDITSNSWGGYDDGSQIIYPDRAVKFAFKVSATEGRAGRGVIHAFSVGNGKLLGDMCGYDFVVNVIQTVTVASCDHNGHNTFFSERCAGVMVTAFSGDGMTPFNIVTTDVNNKCTLMHTGTSASVPIVAAVIALLLKANPKLNWREVHHLIAWTSQVEPLFDNPNSWRRNGAGFYVSEDFGFGLIDAYSLVSHAKKFQSIPEMVACVTSPVPKGSVLKLKTRLNSRKGFNVQFKFDGCKGTPQEVNFLEHVLVQFTATYSRRGTLRMTLISAEGTEAVLLSERPNDNSDEGFQGHVIDSVMTWGESPRGTWSVKIYDASSQKNRGLLEELILILYGTKTKPSHYFSTGRSYPGIISA